MRVHVDVFIVAGLARALLEVLILPAGVRLAVRSQRGALCPTRLSLLPSLPTRLISLLPTLPFVPFTHRTALR